MKVAAGRPYTLLGWLENEGFKQELEQKGKQLQAFKNSIVKSTKSNL